MRVLVLAVLLAVLASCDGGGSPAAAARLVERTFGSVVVSEGGEPRPLVDEPVRAHFRQPLDAQAAEIERRNEARSGAVVLLAWSTGCNTHNALLEVAAGRLRQVEAPETSAGSTLMGCDPAEAAEEIWLSEFFEGTLRWRLDGDRLVLARSGAEIEFVELEAPTPGS